MQEIHVDTPEALAELCDQLRGSPWLALDTEFLREKTYYPQLCLLQVCNGDIAASVDPLALDDLQPLVDVLYDERSVKVFHAGHQDLELFQQRWQRLPEPLFDTQPAAELAGFDNQMGYGRLVQALLGHELDKGHARTDWTRRPLQPAQLRYALDDVIYLGEIYLQLLEQLGERRHDPGLQQTFARLADPATYVTQPEDAWLRVKGRKYLRGNQLKVLRVLAAWREREAIRADKPRGWILKNDVLLDLCRVQPRSLERLKKVRGLTAGLAKRQGEQLLKLIADALPSQDA